jgi:nitroreductase
MGIQASFLDNLEWRRASKHFGGAHVDVEKITDAIVQAPSSFGLQPYVVYKITNKALREELRKVGYNQAQITECQTLYIFCARTDLEQRMNQYINMTNSESREMMARFVQNIKDPLAWSSNQVYIALGFALAAAAEQRIASCPMEGFQKDGVARILELPDTVVPCVMLAVGEWTEHEEPPRFRFPVSDLIVERI